MRIEYLLAAKYGCAVANFTPKPLALSAQISYVFMVRMFDFDRSCAEARGLIFGDHIASKLLSTSQHAQKLFQDV
jgi:hypothetical protein